MHCKETFRWIVRYFIPKPSWKGLSSYAQEQVVADMDSTCEKQSVAVWMTGNMQAPRFNGRKYQMTKTVG